MEKLNCKLNEYYHQFPLRWEEQKYLWKSVRTFQENWNLDAADMAGMIDRATSDADYLIESNRYYLRKIFRSLIEVDRKRVREIFENLFDESQDITKRYGAFESMIEDLRLGHEYKPYLSRKESSAYPVIASTFLWLMYPDRYYFYKYSVAKKVASATGICFIDDTDSGHKMASWFKLLDRVSRSLLEDTRFRQLLDDRLDKTMCRDEQMHCMAIDFAFYIRPLYEGRKNYTNAKVSRNSIVSM